MLKRRKPFTLPNFSVSIQTGRGTYCNPKLDAGPWVKVELGLPSETPSLQIMAYCDNLDEPTETVYGYVPVDLVVEWLQSKGATKKQLESFGFKETTDGVVLY